MINTDQAFVIKRTAFQESDSIVKLLSHSRGMMSAILKNSRQPQKKWQVSKGCLQLCNEIEFSYLERGHALQTMTEVNVVRPMPALSPLALVFVSYIHELLLYLLPDNQGKEIYSLYQWFIRHVQLLEEKEATQAVALFEHERLIRRFEIDFLELSGLGVDFAHDAETGSEISVTETYVLIADLGFIQSTNTKLKLFSGKHLQLIRKRHFSDSAALAAARYICRFLLAHLLNGKVLKSRQLLKDMMESMR